MADIVITGGGIGVVLATGGGQTATTGIAGTNITPGQVVYISPHTGQYLLSQGNSSNTSVVDGIALNSASAGQPLQVVQSGSLNVGTNNPLTQGETYAASAANPGGIAPVGDLTEADYPPTILGVATSDNELELEFLDQREYKQEQNLPSSPSPSLSPVSVLPQVTQTFQPLFGSEVDGMSMWGNATISTVIVPDIGSLQDTNFATVAFNTGIITDYTITTTYPYDPHVLQMPVACSTVADASFATVGNTTLKRVISWTAEKVGAAPTLPDPDIYSTNAVLMFKTFVPMNVELAPGGIQPIYTISGTYVYGIINQAIENMYHGIVPYVGDPSFNETAVGAFQHGLIDDGTNYVD